MNEATLPLVTVGLPTYNRADGLRVVLERVTTQTYTNIEIIVSDNCSPGEAVQDVVSAFSKVDSRVIYFRQPENIGPYKNFEFILSKAKGNYFILAADDDEWVGEDFLSKLVAASAGNVLTFPDAVVLNNQGGDHEYPLRLYKNCTKAIDYSKAFCSTGAGYPFYGLFDLQLFYQLHLSFKLDEDMKYYNEGIFIHNLFLKAPVKYVSEAQILFSPSNSKPAYDLQLESFMEYFRRVVFYYAVADLPAAEKKILLDAAVNNYVEHAKWLWSNISGEQSTAKLDAAERLKKSIKVLIKGTI